MSLLTNDFLEKYEDFPEHMNELGKFVFYRTYSRYLPGKGRRETWKETVARSTEYNVGLGVEHIEKIGYPVITENHRKEAENLFDSMFNLRQFLSGRTLWVGGADGGVADKYPLSNFNCSYVTIRSYEDIGDLFYLLLVGTGVGFRSTKEDARNLPAVRTDISVTHEPYTRRYPLVKEPDTRLFVVNEGKKAVIHVGDSKEGWVEALRMFFRIHTEKVHEKIEEIGIFYDYIRPKGSKLNTFGGTASGHEPLKEMFEGFTKVLHNEMDDWLAPLEKVDENKVKLRPVHILDIGNLVGNNVVVGGVRRTAEIFLFDEDDYESMFAKYGINGIWDEKQHEEVIETLFDNNLDYYAHRLQQMELNDPNVRPLHHRRMSNNTVWFQRKPSRKELNLVFTVMKAEGEPGLGNAVEAGKRRPNAEGVNPCFEILLDSYGVCNLTTVNLVQFVEDGELNEESLLEAQRASARAGLRMTLVDLEIPHWDDVQKRDRLIGTSLTGVKDAMDLLGYSAAQERELIAKLGDVSREEAQRYAHELRVSTPLLSTTVKPEGTISQVAGGVSSGLHQSHSPYYLRRIRINATDPLAKAVQDLGWSIHPEVGTKGETEEERLDNARTLVIDFPIASGAKRTKDDVNVAEQFETYFAFQSEYTDHNSSNTINVKPDEWEEAEEIVHKNWDSFIGVSFLQADGGSYELAPYERISKDRYELMKGLMPEFNPETLGKYEDGEVSDLEGADGCEGGACPVR